MKEELVLAGGCFWGIEEYYQRTNGVLETQVGYVNSKQINPSYEEVCSGKTGAAEGVKIVFETQKISRKQILDIFYLIIDPYSLNRQGMDIGSQYRTGLYFQNDLEKNIYIQDKESRQKDDKREIQVEVMPLENFYIAEEYHQKYLQKNPKGYCHIVLPSK